MSNLEGPQQRPTVGTVFDQTMRSLHGIPDATHVKATTIRTIHPVLELAQTFIVQTVRHREQGDTIFIEYVSTEGMVRIALPPAVSEVIARQRDALTTKSRKRAGKAEALRRKVAGIEPFKKGQKP